MASINATQDQEVTYLSGVTSQGLIANQSYWTWNVDSPATYGPVSREAKWGPPTAGTGATISYAFDPASNWTFTEKAAFVSSMDLWSAVANVSFTEVSADSARLLLHRSDDGGASGGATRTRSQIGSSVLGTANFGNIDIDTSATAFGSLGTSLSNFGGYPWLTLLHELGHVLGFGHAGPYNEGDVDGSVSGTYDTLAWSIMSYNDEGSANDGNNYRWGSTTASNGLIYHDVPTTWMPLDIVAMQRLYGVAVNTPLSGGQVFGFHTNITGNIAKFFDFGQNTKPIVTLWDRGAGNTLDLSGFSQGSTVDLHDGAYSSTSGLTDNIAIAYGTRIDTVVTGPGNDRITANDNSDVVMGGAGTDSITGGSGNDHLYGAAAVVVAGDGVDTINAGAGSDYLQGNAGDDQLNGGDGSDRVQGGQGNDNIVGGTGNDSVNGNLGNDMIDGGDGNDSLRGGQGSDNVLGGADNDLLLGDLGADTLTGGTGIDMLTGGSDADQFNFSSGEAIFATSGVLAGLTDFITDFTDGTDHIHMGFSSLGSVLHGQAFDNFATATAAAQQMLSGQSIFNTVAVLEVGNDSYVFYETGPFAPLEVFKLAGIADPNLITAADFV